MTVLVVSPHLDDAALSVPAWIAARADAGAEVVVLTVFSAGDATHAGRQAEDRAALARLGARALHLGLLDAPLRRGIACSFRALVLGELAADDRDAAAVVGALVERIVALAPAQVLLPLGVGEHIDHRIVHAAHARVPGRVGFYEDRPYACIPRATQARLARLGATVDDVAIAASPAAAAEFLAAAGDAPHLRAYLPAADREEGLARLTAPLLAPAPTSGLRLQGERHDFAAEPRRRAAAAVRAYASQIADLFGDGDAVARAFAGPYAERILWREQARAA